MLPEDFNIQYPISKAIIEELPYWYDPEEEHLSHVYWGQYFDQYIDPSKRVIALPFKDHAKGYYLQGVDKWVEKKIADIKKKDEEKKKDKEQKEFERSLSILYISMMRSLHVVIIIAKVFF
jgi:hypothetical protein